MRLMDIDELWKDITSEIDDCSDVLEIIERHTVIDTSKEIFCSVNVDADEVLERLKELGWKPVKHGRWIDTGEIFTDQFSLDEFPIYECSVCGSRIERKPTLDRFCNWCGAKMDEEDK